MRTLTSQQSSDEKFTNITNNKEAITMSTTNVPVTSRHTANNNISGTMQRPQWLAETLYSFQSRFVEVEGNRIHYIDEGSGPTLLFVHPGVGWSFMYSEIIQELHGRFRCVALDLPGFGLSPAAPGYQHTLTGDSRLLERFISTLGLSDVTLFSHDVTGSIAFGESDASAAGLWRPGCYNQNGVVGSPGAHLPQIYDSAAVASAIRSFWDEEIAA